MLTQTTDHLPIHVKWATYVHHFGGGFARDNFSAEELIVEATTHQATMVETVTGFDLQLESHAELWMSDRRHPQ
jgi:uncharacterized protein YfaP (DUF2135 family)